MRRINYLPGWSERHGGAALPAFAPALRVPLAAFAGALALVAVLWVVQHARLASLESRGAEFARRIAAADGELGEVHAVQRDVAHFRELGARIDAIRRSGPLRAGEIAALGDRLPSSAWLTSLRADRAAFALEGRADRIDAVAASVAGLALLSSHPAVRLLSVRDDPAAGGVTYALSLDANR